MENFGVHFWVTATSLGMSSQAVSMESSSSTMMYKTFATYYDHFYRTKDYEKETCFLKHLLSEYHVHTILDVGCGTGTHLSKLEQSGYACEGIDLNTEMVEIAKTKHKGTIFQADMRTFQLNRRYDAIISMFAVFNHNLDMNDARSTLIQIRNHLNPNGVVILDLYNPQSSGKKVDSYEGITRTMEWRLNTEIQVCESIVKFIEGDKACEEQFLLKIYSIPLLKKLFEDAGFTHIKLYDNYTFNEGSPLSKNLIVVAECGHLEVTR